MKVERTSVILSVTPTELVLQIAFERERETWKNGETDSPAREVWLRSEASPEW